MSALQIPPELPTDLRLHVLQMLRETVALAEEEPLQYRRRHRDEGDSRVRHDKQGYMMLLGYATRANT